MATEFLTRCFAPGETIALLLRREEPASDHAAHRPAGAGCSRRAILRGSLTRTDAARTSMWLPIRFAPAAASAPKRASQKFAISTSISTWTGMPDSLRSGRRMPFRSRPSILSTSPGKYQVLWRVEGFDFEQQESR